MVWRCILYAYTVEVSENHTGTIMRMSGATFDDYYYRVWSLSGKRSETFLDTGGGHGIIGDEDHNTPIILGVLAKDRHFGWQFPGKTVEKVPDFSGAGPDGMFSGAFHLCDDPKYSKNDHHFYFTVYFKGGKWANHDDIYGGTYNYDYDGTSSEGSTSWGPWLADTCGPGEAMFRVLTSNPR